MAEKQKKQLWGVFGRYSFGQSLRILRFLGHTRAYTADGATENVMVREFGRHYYESVPNVEPVAELFATPEYWRLRKGAVGSPQPKRAARFSREQSLLFNLGGQHPR